MISILTILTGGGGGSKIPKIRLTSFVHGPFPIIGRRRASFDKIKLSTGVFAPPLTVSDYRRTEVDL